MEAPRPVVSREDAGSGGKRGPSVEDFWFWGKFEGREGRRGGKN
jgi:hypothetical protein